MVKRVAGTETSARAIESMTQRIELDRASLRAELEQRIHARYALFPLSMTPNSDHARKNDPDSHALT